MALTAKKAASNARHMEKLDRIVIQPAKERGLEIRAAASAAGMKPSPYIMQAIRAQMKADANGGYLVCISRQEAEESAKQKGQTLEEWLADHQ